MTEDTRRLRDVEKFYASTNELKERMGGYRFLADLKNGLRWPKLGVYFFFEPGEKRCHSGQGCRVVRIGKSDRSLQRRLGDHYNKRQISIFRKLIGEALIQSGPADGINFSLANLGEWNKGSATMEPVENEVSNYIGKMPVLVVPIEEKFDHCKRACIEQNAIALLSNYKKTCIDPPSKKWLGRNCKRPRVRQSGLWNNEHVSDEYNPEFLSEYKELVNAVKTEEWSSG